MYAARMRISSLWLAASLALALAGGCKTNLTPDVMGTFTCKDVQNQACVGPTDQFDATVPVVHVLYKTRDLPKTGDTYVIQWIAEDVGQAAPANTVIATVNEAVKDVTAGAPSYVLTTQLTTPTKGWPVGKYRVEIKLADKLVTAAHFTIK